MTPEFQGTHLWDRLGWAKENLEPYRSEYCIVWEDPDNLDEPAKVTHPDPNWMACALNGGILPPVWVYWELKKDEAKPDFVKHTRGYLLHNTEPVKAMTEEEAIAIAQVFKDLEDDTLDFALDEIKYLASCSRTMRKIDEVSKRAEEKLRRLKPKLKLVKNEEKNES